MGSSKHYLLITYSMALPQVYLEIQRCGPPVPGSQKSGIADHITTPSHFWPFHSSIASLDVNFLEIAQLSIRNKWTTFRSFCCRIYLTILRSLSNLSRLRRIPTDHCSSQGYIFFSIFPSQRQVANVLSLWLESLSLIHRPLQVLSIYCILLS